MMRTTGFSLASLERNHCSAHQASCILLHLIHSCQVDLLFDVIEDDSTKHLCVDVEEQHILKMEKKEKEK